MAPVVRRTTVVALVATLVVGLLSIAGPAAPAGAVTIVQNGVAPTDAECSSGRLHTDGVAGFPTIASCSGVTITKSVRVNGADVAGGTALAVGDVITVSVTVAPRGGNDPMYSETVDALREVPHDIDALVPIGLPVQTGALLSLPTNVRMSRTDLGDRSTGPAINCLAQGGDDPARTDAPTAVTVGGVPVGLNGMTASTRNGILTAAWTTMSVDRCARIVSNNGLYPGHTVSFTQTVTSRAASAQSLVWSLGGLTLQRDDQDRSLTWGSGQNASLTLPAAPVTVPGAPSGVVAGTGVGQATVSWIAPTTTGGGPITGYRVTPSIGGAAQPVRSFSSPTTTQVLTGLTPGATYTFAVAAVNSAGVGASSGPSAPVTIPSAPGAPTVVTATTDDGRSTVSWTAPANDGGRAITGYVVTPSIGTAAQPIRTFPTTATTQVLTGLTNGATYTFRVAAVNAIGTGTASAPSNAVTPVAVQTAPAAPSSVTAGGGDTTATVAWAAPATGGSPISAYVVTPYIGSSPQTPRTSVGATTSVVVTGLTNGTTYSFRVAAVNAIGTSPASAPSNLVTPSPDATTPAAPTGVVGIGGRSQVTLSWTAPLTDGGSAIAGYKVTPYIGSTAQAVRTFTGTTTTRAVTGLLDGTTYTFTVSAYNDVGIGAASAPSAPVAPLAPWAPFATADAFTRQQFTDLAGRQPTASELTSWRLALDGETQTAAQLVDSLRTAAHWEGLLAPVVRLYRATFLRDPDVGGMTYWEGELRSGRQTLNRSSEFFARGSEFRQRYGTLDDAGFVTQVYRNVLNRAPSSTDLAYWRSELRRGVGRGRMVLLFSSSPEYRSLTGSRVAVILARYGLLDQVGPTAEVDAAVAIITGGGRITTVIARILASPAYADRVL